MPSYEKSRFLSATLTKSDFESNIGDPILMVQSEPLLTDMVATTPKIEVGSGRVRRPAQVMEAIRASPFSWGFLLQNEQRYLHETVVIVVIQRAPLTPLLSATTLANKGRFTV